MCDWAKIPQMIPMKMRPGFNLRSKLTKKSPVLRAVEEGGVVPLVIRHRKKEERLKKHRNLYNPNYTHKRQANQTLIILKIKTPKRGLTMKSWLLKAMKRSKKRAKRKWRRRQSRESPRWKRGKSRKTKRSANRSRSLIKSPHQS